MSRVSVIAALCGLSLCAQAQTTPGVHDRVRVSFARSVYEHCAADINREAPQPLLRAVVVLRVRLAQDGHWAPEVMRENDEEPTLTRKALDSVATAEIPPDLPDEERDDLTMNGFVEAWLFQNNGHFALKSLAKPQRGL